MQPFRPVTTFNQGQVNQAQGAYNQDVGQAQQAYNAQQQYQQNMQGGTQMYGEQLGKALQSTGFNPQELAQRQQALAQTQKVLGNLPQAVRQQGGGYGVTAGQMANALSQQAGSLQGQLTNQVTDVGQLQDRYNMALGQAQASTQAGQQGQQLQLTALQNSYDQASNIRDQAQQNLQFLEDQFQKQGQFNADQSRQYYVAQATMLQAQAAMKAAEGSYAQAMSAAQQTNLQNAALQRNQAYQMSPNASGGFNYTNAGQPITVQQYNAALGANISPMLGQRAAAASPQTVTGGNKNLMAALGYSG
jgi:hypothetical protein